MIIHKSWLSASYPNTWIVAPPDSISKSPAKIRPNKKLLQKFIHASFVRPRNHCSLQAKNPLCPFRQKKKCVYKISFRCELWFPNAYRRNLMCGASLSCRVWRTNGPGVLVRAMEGILFFVYFCCCCIWFASCDFLVFGCAFVGGDGVLCDAPSAPNGSLTVPLTLNFQLDRRTWYSTTWRIEFFGWTKRRALLCSARLCSALGPLQLSFSYYPHSPSLLIVCRLSATLSCYGYTMFDAYIVIWV